MSKKVVEGQLSIFDFDFHVEEKPKKKKVKKKVSKSASKAKTTKTKTEKKTEKKKSTTKKKVEKKTPVKVVEKPVAEEPAQEVEIPKDIEQQYPQPTKKTQGKVLVSTGNSRDRFLGGMSSIFKKNVPVKEVEIPQPKEEFVLEQIDHKSDLIDLIEFRYSNFKSEEIREDLIASGFRELAEQLPHISRRLREQMLEYVTKKIKPHQLEKLYMEARSDNAKMLKLMIATTHVDKLVYSKGMTGYKTVYDKKAKKEYYVKDGSHWLTILGILEQHPELKTDAQKDEFILENLVLNSISAKDIEFYVNTYVKNMLPNGIASTFLVEFDPEATLLKLVDIVDQAWYS